MVGLGLIYFVFILLMLLFIRFCRFGVLQREALKGLAILPSKVVGSAGRLTVDDFQYFHEDISVFALANELDTWKVLI